MGAEAFARFGHMVVPRRVRERATGPSWSNGLAVQAGFHARSIARHRSTYTAARTRAEHPKMPRSRGRAWIGSTCT